MDADSHRCSLRQIPVLLRGEADSISGWLGQPDARRAALYIAVILAGAGLYGAAVGWWRAPLQAGYNAIKFPLIVLLTTLANALINGMLAPLLGLDLRFRQSLLAVLMSFTIAAAILGSFSPVVLFVVWNTPPLGTEPAAALGAHSFMLVSQVCSLRSQVWRPICVCGNCCGGSPAATPLRVRSCWRGWRPTCSSAVRFPGCCGRSLDRRICR
jgi:hypothetical protein